MRCQRKADVFRQFLTDMVEVYPSFSQPLTVAAKHTKCLCLVAGDCGKWGGRAGSWGAAGTPKG